MGHVAQASRLNMFSQRARARWKDNNNNNNNNNNNLKHIMSKIRIGFIWPRIGTSVELLLTQE
jgi:hypothetical protein